MMMFELTGKAQRQLKKEMDTNGNGQKVVRIYFKGFS